MIKNQPKVGIVIPTFNPGREIISCIIPAIKSKLVKKILVVDSGSTDGSPAELGKYNVNLIEIDKKSFNHGGTRQFALNEMTEMDIVIFLTQDAILTSPNSIDEIILSFEDPLVGVAYGRQIPKSNASAISSHARLFNYPNQSSMRDKESKSELGLKTVFVSNSFAAYRVQAISRVGGFPLDVICTEDMIVAAKMVMSGWKVSYCSNASVYHSHEYNFFEEFKRYFDIGALHSREKWLIEEFGKPEGEGIKFVRSEFAYLMKNAPLDIPSALVRTFFKYFGYKLGRCERSINPTIKSHISLNSDYWKTHA